jgi:hypothetical protein
MDTQALSVGIENILFRIDIVGWLDFAHGVAKHGKLRKLEWYDTVGYLVENTLRRYAIHGYGRGVAVELEPGPDGKKRKVYRRWLWINAKQAAWAEYVLLRSGLTLISVIDPRNVAWAQQHDGEAPTPWQGGKRARAATPVEGAFDVMGALFGFGDEQLGSAPRRRQNRSRGRRSARRNR